MTTEMQRTYLEEYARKYEYFWKMTRKNGILELRYHTNDGPFQWNMEAHRSIPLAYSDINADPENECLIVTGTGDTFASEVDHDSFTRAGYPDIDRNISYNLHYVGQTREPACIVNNYLPVISAINGPATRHLELCLLGDIVICSENTYFADEHFKVNGIPGDGVNIIFRTLFGYNRSRYLLYTATKIDAREALQLGAVAEVLPREKLLDRAWEIAETIIMPKPRETRRLTHSLLMQPWKELFDREMHYSIVYENMGFHCRRSD